MPAGDGSGPMGMGPMTGRAAGFCAGYNVPGYTNPVGGQGMGFGRGAYGRGGGRGRRNMFYATGLTGWQRSAPGNPVWGGMPQYAAQGQEPELNALKTQAEYFEGTLSELRKRIEELESGRTEK